MGERSRRTLALVSIVCISIIFSLLATVACQDMSSSRLDIRGYVNDPGGGCSPDNPGCDHQLAVRSFEEYIFNRLNHVLMEAEVVLDFEVTVRNLFFNENRDAFREMYSYDLDGVTFPLIFVNDRGLFGWEAIEEELEHLLFAELGEESPRNRQATRVEFEKVEYDTIVYFKLSICSGCREIEDFINTLQGERTFRVIELDMDEAENISILRAYSSKHHFNWNDITVPFIIIGDRYLEGVAEIKMFLEAHLERGLGVETLVPIR